MMSDFTPYLPGLEPPVVEPPKPAQRAWVHWIYVALDLMVLLYLALDLDAINDPNPLVHLSDSGLGLFIGGFLLGVLTLPLFIFAIIAYPRIRYRSTKIFARISFIALGAAIFLTLLFIFLGGYVESDAGWWVLHPTAPPSS